MATIIDPLSVQSILIEMFFGDRSLATGTAFIALAKSGAPHLITNRHNFTLRRQEDGQPMFDHGGVPDQVRIWFNSKNVGYWKAGIYELYGKEGPLWKQHPIFEDKCDVVALPLVPHDELEFYPFNVHNIGQPPLKIGPSDAANIIGFPFGRAAGRLFAIWVTGFVASEMSVNYDGLPRFLIDSRTRPGQSGSPVVAIRQGTVKYANNSMGFGADAREFLGIYGGRIHPDSDIGIVWKREVIHEILDPL